LFLSKITFTDQNQLTKTDWKPRNSLKRRFSTAASDQPSKDIFTRSRKDPSLRPISQMINRVKKAFKN
jgi:hypothetical protein